MDFRDAAATSGRAQALAAALDDADRFAPPEAALQTRQLLGAIRCRPAPDACGRACHDMARFVDTS
jgi:hypothetical protein